jgi:parallel beta-helix repeat protein
MKKKKYLVLLLVIFLLTTTFALGRETKQVSLPIKTQYNTHEPIYIKGNSNFTEANGITSGKGTADDPYIIEGWDISAASQDGITIINTSVFFIIRNCFIHDGAEKNDGIAFLNVTNGKVELNIITRNRYGIVFREQKAGKENCENNIITNNSLTLNKIGISFQHLLRLHHCNNTISYNRISNNGAGIYMTMSANNLIAYNNFILNNEYAIIHEMCRGGGQYNLIHHNNFIGNEGEKGQVCEKGLPVNYWNREYPFGGNYWSDYTGSDTYQGPDQDIPGSDGIGDTPYTIPPGKNEDAYPLMKPWYGKNSPPLTPRITGPTFGKVGEEYEYIFYTIDLNGDDVYYYIDWGDQTFEEWIGPYKSGEEITISHTWKKKGTYFITAKARDTQGAESYVGNLCVTIPRCWFEKILRILINYQK